MEPQEGKGTKKYIGIILPTDLALLVLSWGILNPSWEESSGLKEPTEA